MLPTLSQIIVLLGHYKYGLLIPIAFVDGPIIMVISGFLIKLGYFDFWPAYLALMFGDLLGDVFWYGVGYYGAQKLVKRFGRFFGLTPERLAFVETIFKKHQKKTMFISKITMGFGFALVTLIASGLMKIDFKRFLWINFLGQLVWTAGLLAIGYFFGYFYNAIDKGFKDIAFVSFIVIVGALLYGWRKYLQTKNNV